MFDIPSNPTREEARAALDEICDLLSEFPFVADDGTDATGIASASRSVVLSYILTALVRRSLPTSPIHGFSATEAGTGKGKLVQIGAAMGIGHTIAATPFNESPEEFEKSISASLLAGALVIPLDNLEGEFSNALLCAATTEQVEIRIFGALKKAKVPNSSMITLTGNNLTPINDMGRRTMKPRLMRDLSLRRRELLKMTIRSSAYFVIGRATSLLG